LLQQKSYASDPPSLSGRIYDADQRLPDDPWAQASPAKVSRGCREQARFVSIVFQARSVSVMSNWSRQPQVEAPGPLQPS
jgi:hypothetical protein